LTSLRTLERILLDYQSDQLDLLLGGSPQQQALLYLCHLTLGLQTQLIQSTPTGGYEAWKTERATQPYVLMRKQAYHQDPNRSTHWYSPKLKNIYRRAEHIGQSQWVRALIRGENGTGKAHLARFIHARSPRQDAPFHCLNCACLDEPQLKQRLWGNDAQPGLLDQLQGGTLLLDEVEACPLSFQQDLLYFLESGQHPYQPGKESSDLRVLAATQHDLVERCEEGSFRWDLYYLLASVELVLPSLYERGGDEIERLLEYFLQHKQVLFGRQSSLKLKGPARKQLLDYRWPGNVRELEHVVESLYLLGKTEIEAGDLPLRISTPPSSTSEKWRDVEAAHLRNVYERYGRNKSKTQAAIGYGSINTLKKKLREYGIE